MSAQGPSALKASASCPICNEVAIGRFRPFCSQRCADLDLGRWLSGSYAIAADEPIDSARSTEADDSVGQLPHRGRGH